MVGWVCMAGGVLGACVVGGVCKKRRMVSGWYSSYWNAFLLSDRNLDN